MSCNKWRFKERFDSETANLHAQIDIADDDYMVHKLLIMSAATWYSMLKKNDNWRIIERYSIGNPIFSGS